MPYRVLIVDDQREVSRLLRSALETIEQGLIVSEAPSGEEALLEASRSKIDLLIADYRLPGMTGVELMRKIRARYPQAAVILVSGVTDPRMRAEITKAEANASFLKPVPMSEFLAAVEHSLGLTPTVIVQTPSARPEPAPRQEEDRLSLPALLIELRQSLQARVVLMFNDRGQILAEAGDLPDPANRIALIAALMSLHSAAQKVANIVGRAEHHLHLFDADQEDTLFLPVGPSQAILAIGSGLADLVRLPQTLETLDASRRQALLFLKQIGEIEDTLADQPKEAALSGTPAYLEAATLPNDFDDLFQNVAVPKQDASAFWDSLVESGTRFTQPDKLTYEQAMQLGLAPKDSEK